MARGDQSPRRVNHADRENDYAPEGTEYPTEVQTSDAGRRAPLIDTGHVQPDEDQD